MDEQMMAQYDEALERARACDDHAQQYRCEGSQRRARRERKRARAWRSVAADLVISNLREKVAREERHRRAEG